MRFLTLSRPEAEFLDKIQTKVLIVCLLAIHSHLYSFALIFRFLQTHATSYIFLQLTQPITYFFKLTQPHTYFYSSVTVHCKEERRKPDRKPYSLPYGLRSPYRNHKSENFQDYAQEPQQNCMFMNSALEAKLSFRTASVSEKRKFILSIIFYFCSLLIYL